METTFRYRLDRRSKRITTAIGAIVLGGFAASAYFGVGGYLPAWFLATVIAVTALYVLSIPNKIAVTEQAVEIRCLVELTRIHLNDIRSIRRIETAELKYTIPLLGSYGFFGYYGYYFNFRNWEMIKLYASAWSDFVMIEDIYEQKYVVNCHEADRLVECVEEARDKVLQ